VLVPLWLNFVALNIICVDGCDPAASWFVFAADEVKKDDYKFYEFGIHGRDAGCPRLAVQVELRRVHRHQLQAFLAKVIDVIGQNSYPLPETDKLKMVVEVYLRIEFEQSKYHMQGVVVGLIKHKALNIARRETTGLAGDVQQRFVTPT